MEGKAEKLVACEHSAMEEFRYEIMRRVGYEVPVFPRSRQLLQRTCGTGQLAKRLAKDVEPMSCPSCGWVQAVHDAGVAAAFCWKDEDRRAVRFSIRHVRDCFVHLGQLGRRGFPMQRHINAITCGI